MPPFVPEPGEQGEGFGAATLANATGAPSPNRGGIFYKYNTGGKRSITVDARHPEGPGPAEGPGGRQRRGHRELRGRAPWPAGASATTSCGELKPDIIYVSMCGFGHTGPDTSHVTMGPTAQALTGLTFMVGPARPAPGGMVVLLPRPRRRLPRARSPSWPGSSTGAAPARASTSTCPSSSRPPPCRARCCSTPRSTTGPAGGPDFPTGNRRAAPAERPRRAPTGPRARTSGSSSRAGPRTQWQALVDAMGSPAWAARRPLRHPGGPRRARRRPRRPSSRRGRRRATATRSWTCSRRPGCPAGAVQDAADRLERDPQLAARGHFTSSATPRWRRCRSRACPSACRPRRPHTGGRAAPGPPLPRRGQRRRSWASCSGSTPTTSPPWRPRGPCRERRASRDGAARRGARPRARRRVGRVLRAAAGRARCRRGEGRARPRARRRAPIGPFLDDEPGPDRSLAFWADNVGKRSVWSHDDDDAARRCARAADVVVHTLRPGRGRGAGASTTTPLARAHPGPDRVRRHPLRPDGPWADYLADDLVLMALGGSMAACGYGPGPTALRHPAAGLPRRPGLADGGDLRRHRRAGRAWPGAARRGRRTGGGQFIDVSAHECSASMTEWHLMTYLCSGARAPARARTPPSPGPTAGRWPRSTPTSSAPTSSPACSRCSRPTAWPARCRTPPSPTPRTGPRNYGEVWRALKRLAEKHDGEELYRLASRPGCPGG